MKGLVKANSRDDLYIPQLGEITHIEALNERERYFEIELEYPLKHQPGQFVMISIPGLGEAAISISCGPESGQQLQVVIRQAGQLTTALHQLQVGQMVGIRGPFGQGFDLEEFYGRHILVVAGGLGLVPLRSLLIPLINEIDRLKGLTLITGSRTPAEVLFRQQLHDWQGHDGVTLIEMVDQTADLGWDGRVGLVTEPISELNLDANQTLVVLCGPPVMYKFVLMELSLYQQIPEDQIFLDLERRMRCGVGKCGHCQINHLYCCQQGPVFRYSDIKGLEEAL